MMLHRDIGDVFATDSQSLCHHEAWAKDLVRLRQGVRQCRSRIQAQGEPSRRPAIVVPWWHVTGYGHGIFARVWSRSTNAKLFALRIVEFRCSSSGPGI
jgi:hypothetical protein